MDIAGKLQLKPDMSIAVVGAPLDFDRGFVDARETAPAESADALLLFSGNAAELDEGVATLLQAVRRDALTWVAYPKAGQLGTDLNRDLVREAIEPLGARTVRLISLDDVWSALRLRPA
jgi:hypothetical protein